MTAQTATENMAEWINDRVAAAIERHAEELTALKVTATSGGYNRGTDEAEWHFSGNGVSTFGTRPVGTTFGFYWDHDFEEAGDEVILGHCLECDAEDWEQCETPTDLTRLTDWVVEHLAECLKERRAATA